LTYLSKAERCGGRSEDNRERHFAKTELPLKKILVGMTESD
jgi:hypothetical protein